MLTIQCLNSYLRNMCVWYSLQNIETLYLKQTYEKMFPLVLVSFIVIFEKAQMKIWPAHKI